MLGLTVSHVEMEVEGEAAHQPEAEPNLDHIAQQCKIYFNFKIFMRIWTSVQISTW